MVGGNQILQGQPGEPLAQQLQTGQFLLQSPSLDAPPGFAHLLCSASSLPLDPPSVMWLSPCSSTEWRNGRELTCNPAGS